ncbi:MAG: hypothetical protein JXB17_11635 [Bacteroidales bacterium]|nr:hypothetical protein [Bacteroidales bacterium]
MKIKAEIILITVCIFFLLYISCEKEDNSSVSSIEENWDAKVTASEVTSIIYPFILYSRTKDKIWNNEIKEGTRGTIKINGSYEYTEYSYTFSYPDYYYEFNNVVMTLNKLSKSDDDDALIITGSANINGSIHEKSGSVSSSYSGGWVLTCNLSLEGEYNDEITLTLNFSKDSMVKDYTGTLTNSKGTSFTLTSNY